ncbi:hypothetical protein [Actinoplanes sp. L3-i22]|uniref:hypothetical protein n=1 Tax=Actinoplanes sp. L3-i22 TaxID=2836373 RepID=UPI001C7603DE|nr:hypothetical protein [Actinoplanes sp. L3-i22]BCY13199.1 hypothetical protein L3i22_082870 [Actinoplanes sp. L3-i22]
MTDQSSKPPDRPGWWHRLASAIAALWRRWIAALRGPDPAPYVPPTPPPPPGRLVTRRTITPLTVPARGFAFHFQIHGVFIWRSDGLDRDALDSLVERFLPYAHHHLKDEAIGLAREVEPHRGGDFERRLRNRLDQLGEWKYEKGGQHVTCRPQIRIQLDERVRQHIRPYWEQLITLDYERDLAARRARHADGVSSQWAAILKRLLDGPVPDGAARMTNDQLAAVVRDLLAERGAEAPDPLTEAFRNLDPDEEYAREGYFELFGARSPRPSQN